MLAEVDDDTLLRTFILRKERDPLAFFSPIAPEQEQAITLVTRKGLLIIGGNRSGKTQTGAIRVCAKATGRWSFRKARRIWCVSQDLPGQSAKDGEPEQPHTQLEAIKRWMPKKALRGGCWAKAYSPSGYVLTLADGCKIEFKSYDQDLLTFESAAVDHIWYDEEPTRRAIFSSCLLRLVDRAGTWDMTLTPVHSLHGKAIIAEELWDNRALGESGDSPWGKYDAVQLFTNKNIALPPMEVKQLENLPDEERQVRLYGLFARLGGVVLSEFIPQMYPTGNLVPDQIPPKDWRHVLYIDPGWHRSGHLWAAINPKADIVLYGEHYPKDEPIPVRMAVLHGMWQAYGCPEVDVVGDSAAFDNFRQGGTEKVHPSDIDEYRKAAEALGATWFKPRKCKKGDSYAHRVKRYLHAKKLLVCEGMTWWRWEQGRWTRQREREGLAAAEKPVPDKPIDRFNHLMDLTRYLCNEMPPLIADPPSDVYDPVKKFWARHLAPEPVGGYDGT